MKIDKLVKIAAGGLAALALSAGFSLGTAPERLVATSVSTQAEGQPIGNIDWP
ncbi:hypothetical protein ACIQWZ_03170 [Streptomyces sp. NPDC098077]|uniref:hypothetical protein n=1 Tax=Streptomyces sp. NPDC098077 TaxID=3366093 RepID=UPI00382CA89B